MYISHLLFSHLSNLAIICICKAFSFDAINYGNLLMKFSSRKTSCFLDTYDYGPIFFSLLSAAGLF